MAAGDGQGATVGTAVAVPPAVIARDRFGNPVPGVGVVFAVASGDGSLTGTNPVTTNGDGIAAIGGWTLGALTGANSLTATSTGLVGSPLTFTATGTSANALWPNEPARFTALADQAWTAWDTWLVDPQNGYMSLVANQDGPLSSPSAIQWRYPQGLVGGGDPPGGAGSARFDLPADRRTKELYAGLWFKVSADFQGHTSGVQKLYYLSAHGTTRNDLWLEVGGTGSGPLGVRIAGQFDGLDPINIQPNQTDGLPDPHAGEIPVVISRGVWHQYELYIKLPPTSGGNGMLRVWMDGVLAINRTDVSMSFDANNGWVQFRQDPIWGGVDDTKAHEDFLWYDHTYISAP